jgi:N-acyl-L-homoserine lactone synthetase
MLGLMAPIFERVFKRAGIRAYRYGPILDQRDGPICVLRLDFHSEYAQCERLAFA